MEGNEGMLNILKLVYCEKYWKKWGFEHPQRSAILDCYSYIYFIVHYS